MSPEAADQRIPALESPYGPGSWQQPGRDNIEIDNTHALMTRDTFAQLLEYSATIPTGVYVGKMWRRQTVSGWLLAWFGPGDDPDTCSINWREVLLV